MADTATYYARICFNSQGWRFPTGEAKELESDTWVSKRRFGGEEWLFNFAWLMGGYHHAFLQSVNRSFNRVSGETFNVMLYTINQTGDRVFVGEIQSCQALTDSQALEALTYYRRIGWLKDMKQHVKAIGGTIDIADSDARHVFNVRFLPSNATIYGPQRIAAPGDRVQRLQRYSLVSADESVVRSQWRRRKGTKVPPTVSIITRKGLPGVTYDPIHKALQSELLSLLQSEYGHRAVILEENFVDITIKVGKRTTFVEIKSDSDARIAIRNALGQILEYAYFDATSAGPVDLVVVAPGLSNEAISRYIDRLRSALRIPISYGSFSLGSGMLPGALQKSRAAR